ncbi:hypothetical protein VNI00_006951 [Paramarasmius palmivorus]|uniref:Uncharacterized protein n=1 Tax=Paramarasmius palmivorus TaxID=297713 RepID=A0AAW0D6E4_9AGAR
MATESSSLRVPSSDVRQHPYRQPLYQDEDAEPSDGHDPEIEGAVHFLQARNYISPSSTSIHCNVQEAGRFRVDDDDTEGHNGHEEQEEEELELSMLLLIIVQLAVMLAMSIEPSTFGFVLNF